MLDFLKNGKGEILNLMFLNPDKRFYLAEIAKMLGKESSAYQRYIESFIEDGMFCEERIGNMRFFWLNKEYYLYDEIKKIISKTIGIEARLRDLLESIDSIEISFIFGSFATDKFDSSSDIDLFIIGEADHDIIVQTISKLEMEIGRSINYHVYGKEEVLKKMKIKDSFVNNIFDKNIILLKGNLNDIRKSS